MVPPDPPLQILSLLLGLLTVLVSTGGSRLEAGLQNVVDFSFPPSQHSPPHTGPAHIFLCPSSPARCHAFSVSCTSWHGYELG